MTASQLTTAPLTRAVVADAALELFAAEGHEAVTMRRIASILGVGTMTLYGYFRSKDELLNAALDRASADIPLPPRRGSWRRQLELLVVEIHAALRRYPVALELRATRPILSPGMLRTTDRGMEILRSAGFGTREAAQHWRLLFTYAFGYAAFTPASLSEAERRQLTAQLRSLPEHDLPHVAGAAPEAAAAMGGSETFASGLAVLLDGLEVAAARASS